MSYLRTVWNFNRINKKAFLGLFYYQFFELVISISKKTISGLIILLFSTTINHKPFVQPRNKKNNHTVTVRKGYDSLLSQPLYIILNVFYLSISFQMLFALSAYLMDTNQMLFPFLTI